MIELLIAACLSPGTTDCRDFSLLFHPSELSVMACALHGQQEIVRWCDQHPTWTVTRWTCSYRAPGSVDI
jgi:hypothetical protein